MRLTPAPARIRRGAHAQQDGEIYEALAALYLRAKGYRILATRLRTLAGEIDLLAEKGAALVIVEVKKRGTAEGAGAAIGPAQQLRLKRAAAHIIARYGQGKTLRFDAVLFGGGFFPRHIENAF